MGVWRFAPLSGVVAVVLILAGFAVAGNAPKGTSSVAKVAAYFTKHGSAQTTSGVLLSLGAWKGLGNDSPQAVAKCSGSFDSKSG